MKHLYSNPNDEHESKIHGFIVDIVKKGSVIEIQTGGFPKIKNKLYTLLPHYNVKLVYPIAFEKMLIVYDNKKENILYKRRSPKKGELIDIVDEIIYIPKIIIHPNFSLDVLLTNEEEIRSSDGKGSWHRKGISIIDRRLLNIVKRIEFYEVQDYLKLLPNNLPSSFTNMVLSKIMKKPIRKVQKLSYTLKQIGLLQVIGKQGKAQVFKIVS